MKRFDFHNINLIPKKCIVASRSQCNTSISLGKFTFRMPIVPANMECIIDDHLAEKLARHNYFYIHHRFNTDPIQFAHKMRKYSLPVSISIGVNQDAHNLLDKMIQENAIPDFITIDIAHGHSVKMQSILQAIKEKFAKTTIQPFIIAGNVSTEEAVQDLERWGANAIKVGIGPGSACTTYNMTGFGSRNCQASIVEACAKAKKNSLTKIIADGGIKDPGDIAKALVLGADFVMVGGMLSGLSDSPGNSVMGTDGNLYKEFWGSASEFQSGKKGRIEGTKKLIHAKQHGILEEMKHLEECLQSAISYGGGSDLSCFKEVNYL